MQSNQCGSIRMENGELIIGCHRPIRAFEFPLESFPSYIDLRKWMTPIEDQQQMNTCTANAYAGACEYILKRCTGRHIDVSRLFIYYNARRMQNQSLIVTDNGTSLESTAIGLQIFGVCEEYIWSYHSENINQQPPVYVYGQASKMTVVPLKLARNLIAMKTCLANEIPFIIAIRLMPQASDEVRDNNGYLLMPNLNDPQLKSSPMHAVVIVGYDDGTETFIVRNSWGSKWGSDGYFYIPYKYLLETNLIDANDGIWAITDIVRHIRSSPSSPQTMLIDHSSANKKVKKRSIFNWLFRSCSSRNQ